MSQNLGHQGIGVVRLARVLGILGHRVVSVRQVLREELRAALLLQHSGQLQIFQLVSRVIQQFCQPRGVKAGMSFARGQAGSLARWQAGSPVRWQAGSPARWQCKEKEKHKAKREEEARQRVR